MDRNSRKLHDAPASVTTRTRGLILVVEDNEMILETCREFLQESGYEVVTAEDAEKALQQFNRHQQEIRLAVVDLNMPGKTGEDLLIEFRRVQPGLRAIICSGMNYESIRDRLTDLDIFLQKPFPPQMLTQLVEETIADGQ